MSAFAPCTLLLLAAGLAPSALAAEVSLSTTSGALDGAVVSSPTTLSLRTAITGKTAGHTYQVRVKLPPTAHTNPAGGAGSVTIDGAQNVALHTFTAELLDTTGGGQVLVDRTTATVIDLTPFQATWGDVALPESDGLRFHVTELGVDGLDPYVPDIAAELGFSVDDALATVLPAGTELPAQEEETCESAGGMSGDEWAMIWDGVTTLVQVLVPAAAPVIEALDAFVDSTTVCFGGVHPVVTGVAIGPSEIDLSPADGGMDAVVTLGAIDADIDLVTSVSVTIDAVSLATDLLNLAGVDIGVAGAIGDLINIPGDGTLEFSLIDLGLCHAYYDTEPGSLATLEYAMGITAPDLVVFADSGTGAVSFATATYTADGACGWGIFEERLERSRDNIEEVLAEQIGPALGVGEGEDSWIALTLDEACADVTPTATAAVTFASDLVLASGTRPTGSAPDPGGLDMGASTSAAGDGTFSVGDGVYDQTHSGVSFSHLDPTDRPYGIGAAVAATTLNQALAAGAASAEMAYAWNPTWTELGQCASAPSGASCDDAAILDGDALGRLYRPLRAIGASTVTVQFTPTFAPFTAVDVDPVGEPNGHFFLGSYRMQLVDDATGAVWVEITAGAASDLFEIALGGSDGRFDYTLPGLDYRVTGWALGAWPSDAALVSALAPLLDPMLSSATAALGTVPALEMSACAAAGCTVTGTLSTQRDGVFLAYGRL